MEADKKIVSRDLARGYIASACLRRNRERERDFDQEIERSIVLLYYIIIL
jgi:hypothetical protein